MSKRPSKKTNQATTVNRKEKQTELILTQTEVKPSPNPNLTIVKQQSLSSQDAGSRRGSQESVSVNKKYQERQIAKEVIIPIKEEAKQEEEGVTNDQYNILKISGLLDAYEHFLKLLCKHGLPTGKVFDYAAQEIERYEKHKINKELKMRAELDIQKISKRSQLSLSPPTPPRTTSLSPYGAKRRP